MITPAGRTPAHRHARVVPVAERRARMLKAILESIVILLGPEPDLHLGDDAHALDPDDYGDSW
ncbi:hypothetical protein GCM10029978_004950 [Actinoallomurus acanthiterrae]